MANLRLLHRVGSGSLLNLGSLSSRFGGSLGSRRFLPGSLLSGLSLFLLLLLLGGLGSLGLLLLEGGKEFSKKAGTLGPILLLSFTLSLKLS